MFCAVLGWIKIALLAFLLAEMGARIGGALLDLFAVRAGRGALGRFGLGLLLGFGTLGLFYLGMACSGLFYHSTLIVSAIGMLFAARPVRFGPSLLLEAICEWMRLGPPAWAVTVLGLGCVLPGLLIPPIEHDTYLYHLGVPWQYLQVHRLVVTHVSWTFHYPLLMEMIFALPIILQDDRLVKWIVSLCFVAANAVFAGICVARGRRQAAWLGPLLAIGVRQAFELLTQGKNDLAASSFFIAGALLWIRRAWLPGAFLLGLCMSAKMTHAPLVAVWVFLLRPPRRRMLGAGTILLLPLFLWLLKSYAATANPLYPFASGLFHSYDWSAAQEGILREFLGESGQASGVARLSEMPFIWWQIMRSQYVFTLLLIPGFFLPGFPWRPALVCVLAQAATLMIGHNSRYLLPTAWFMGLLAASSAESLYGWPRKLAVMMLAAASVAHVTLMIGLREMSWGAALLSRQEYLARNFTAYEDTARKLKSLGTKRILSIGERLVYRLRGRIFYGGQIGEAPLVWKMAGESNGPERIRIKFKQLGVEYVLFNYVSAKWLAIRYAPFPWEWRNLDSYRQYWIRHHEVFWHSGTCDQVSGGIYLFRIRDVPSAPTPAVSWFLPGTEQLYADLFRMKDESMLKDQLELCLRVLELLPDVGHSWSRAGETYFMLEDFRNAYKSLANFARAGMMDESNFFQCGTSALAIGRLEEGEDFLGRALECYPQQQDPIRINLAQVQVLRSVRHIEEGKLMEIGQDLAQATGFLAPIDVKSLNAAQAKLYFEIRANILAVEGEMLWRTGRLAEAGERFRQAAAIVSDRQKAVHLQAIADQLAPRVMGP